MTTTNPEPMNPELFLQKIVQEFKYFPNEIQQPIIKSWIWNFHPFFHPFFHDLFCFVVIQWKQFKIYDPFLSKNRKTKNAGWKIRIRGNHCFGQVQIVVVMSKRFGRVQIILVRYKLYFYGLFFYNLHLFKMIWTRPKQIGPFQNDWDSTKMIWSVQNHFGPRGPNSSLKLGK